MNAAFGLENLMAAKKAESFAPKPKAPRKRAMVVLYEFEDARQFGAQDVKARDPEEAAQLAFESSAEDNDLELEPTETWHTNDRDWRLILVIAGTVKHNRQLLWGDSYDPASENRSEEPEPIITKAARVAAEYRAEKAQEKEEPKPGDVGPKWTGPSGAPAGYASES